MKYYKGYELRNLKCMMLDIPKISREFESQVDSVISLKIHDDYAIDCISIGLKALNLGVLSFDVVKGK